MDVAAEAVGDGGRGPVADEVLHADRSGSLRATTGGRRVVLGEPECTGSCCGFLSVFVQRLGDIVQWSGWEIPSGEAAPPEFHFAADQYDAEVDRACADR